MKAGAFSVLTLAFVALAAASLCSGSGGLSCADVISALLLQSADETANLVVWQIRLPRLAAAVLSGASLALAGAGMQSLFRNPLADPSITGVSSGAALGAVLAVSFFPSAFGVELGALLVGLAAAVAVCAVGRSGSKMSAVSTLLAGIAVNAFCGALVGFFMYSVRDAGMRGFVFWSLGSLERCGWEELGVSFALCVPAWVAMLCAARPLNVMLLGEENAFDCGVDVSRTRFAVVAAAAVMTAASVSICGIIGFVGLVVPHVLRMVAGTDNRFLMPLSALGGATLLVLADVVSRAFSQTDPVPIGVITALMGAPFFAALLRSKGVANARH